MIKLVAFDWNGTLIADAQLASEADNYALSPYLKKSLNLKTLRRYFTIPVMDYMKAVGMNPGRYKIYHKKINQTFNEYYESRVNKCRTRSGTKDSLRFLQSNAIDLVIYSNHVIPYINRQLKRLNIEQYFKIVLARPEGDFSHMHTRGKQQKLEKYIKTHKIKPREVVSVGDTEEEIEIGKQLGYHTVAITGGYNTTARLKKHHPDFLIHNMLELKKIIKILNT